MSWYPWKTQVLVTALLFGTLAAAVVVALEQQQVDAGPLIASDSGQIAAAHQDHPGAQTLETTVQDPAHPLEPWKVTTYRRPDESYPAFIKRHRDTVEAVRETLGGD